VASRQFSEESKGITVVINLDADLLGEVVDFVVGKPAINHDIYSIP